MPITRINNAAIFYDFLDSGKEKTILFSNSLGTNHKMWKAQKEALSQYYNLLFQDTRGHGKSEVTFGEYSAELLGNDVISLLDKLNLDRVVFCGLSMGGLIGQWLGINAPNRIEKLILCNTAAKIGTKEGWNKRIEDVSKNGLESIVAATEERWFTKGFINSSKNQISPILEVFANTNVQGYCSNCAMVRDADFTEELSKISVPTLIICGTEDEVTTVKHGEFMQEQVINSRLKPFYAAHLSNVQAAKDFNKTLIDFIK